MARAPTGYFTRTHAKSPFFVREKRIILVFYNVKVKIHAFFLFRRGGVFEEMSPSVSSLVRLVTPKKSLIKMKIVFVN